MRALRSAVRTTSVAHAYLFSGPRGTGKTTSARLLAKALNCERPRDGEPAGLRELREITKGTSLDVTELDAASTNGVDAIRDLINRAALGTPGRWKVYIFDEVHMLSTAASNALLKTLEEPPGHVVFVLATTDPKRSSRRCGAAPSTSSSGCSRARRSRGSSTTSVPPRPSTWPTRPWRQRCAAATARRATH